MHSNKLSLNLFIVILTTILSIGLAQAQDTDLPETSFAYVGSWSGLTLFRNFEKPFWGEHIEEASDGRVTVQVTTFDQMGVDSNTVFRLLDKGMYDIGAATSDYAVGDAPALAGLDMPMIAPDVETAHEVVEVFRPVLADIMQENFGAKLLSVVPYPPQVVFCNVPISSLADLAGKKIRAAGGSETDFIKSIGAASITMEFSEVSGALQRGVIDCAISGSLSGYSSGWYEVADYLYALPVGGWDYVVTAMNGQKWESLDSILQEWLQDQVSEQFEEQVWSAAVKQAEEGVNCLTGQGECSFGEPGNMQLVEATQEDIDLAHEKLEDDVLPAWSRDVDEKWVQRWNETIGELVGIEAAADGT